jgi:hypothetical protein
VRLSRPRRVSANERSILDTLLAPEFPGVQALRDQLDGVTVVGLCDCGCPTIDFNVPRVSSDESLRATGTPTPYQGIASSLDGEPVGDIILFVDDGHLASLEYVAHAGPPPDAWPPIELVSLIGPIG